MPNERELRVEKTQLEFARGWLHGVFLECDEEGSRVGPFDEQMVEDLDGALFILRELVSKKASALVDEGRLARISYAIQHILKEAEDG